MEGNRYSVARGDTDERTGAPFSLAEIEALKQVGVDPAPPPIPDLSRIDPTCRMEKASRDLHETAAQLCILPSMLRQRIRAGRLLGFWSEQDKCWKLPEIQFNGMLPLPGLEQVLMAVPSEWLVVEIYGFLTTLQPDLEDEHGRAMTPAAWLRMGHDSAAVIRLLNA